MFCLIGICSFILTFLIKLALIYYVKNYEKHQSHFQIEFNPNKFNTIVLAVSVGLSLLIGFNIELLSSLYVISFILYIYLSNMKLFICLKHISFPNRYLILYFLTLLIPFSNSFVIRESICLRYILIGIIILSCDRLLKIIEYIKLIIVLILCRLGEIFYICREEVQDTCQRYDFSLSITKIVSNDSNYLLYYVLLSVIVVCSTYFMLFDKHVKRIAIKNMLRFQLFIQIVYWFIQLNNVKMIYLNLNQLLPRIFYMLTLMELFLLFYKTKQVEIYTLIAILFQLIVLLVGENRCISICILVFIINILTSIKNQDKTIDKTMITLIILQQYFFYATGHENTFTNIRWEVAFHGLDGNSKNLFVALNSGLFLFLSTFSSSILVFTYLVNIIKQFSRFDKKTEIDSNITKYISLSTYSFLVSLKVSKLNRKKHSIKFIIKLLIYRCLLA